MQIQENLQNRLDVDALRLVILANTLEASEQDTDLETGLAIMKWWKCIVKRDLAVLEQELKMKYLEINKEDGVFKSIEGMQERIQDSVDLLTRTFHIIERPEPLVCLCLEKVEEENLDLKDLPVTLKDQARHWRTLDQAKTRASTKLLAKVVQSISHIL